MVFQSDHHIDLRDGRRLGYAECGDPQGKPVLHFHGTPSSRFEGSLPVADAVASRLGVRLILPDRPGMGLSTFKPRRRLLDWPDDVLELADALGLERFAVMGLSGGGPYIAACAYKIPERLVAAGIISGVSPPEKPANLEGVGKTDRQALELARISPGLLRLVLGYAARQIRSDPDRAVEETIAELCAPDRAVLAQPDLRNALVQATLEAFRQGGRGPAWDYVVLTRLWGFTPQEIHLPVYLWHGEDDTTVPLRMGRWMAKAIPGCNTNFLPGEGHISLIANHFEAILGAVAA